MDKLFKIFDGFSDFSGLRVNYDTILKNSDAKLIGQKPLNWVKEIKVLDITFSCDRQNMMHANYDVLQNYGCHAKLEK